MEMNSPGWMSRLTPFKIRLEGLPGWPYSTTTSWMQIIERVPAIGLRLDGAVFSSNIVRAVATRRLCLLKPRMQFSVQRAHPKIHQEQQQRHPQHVGNDCVHSHMPP